MLPVLASGASVIALIGWLCSLADVWSRRAGVLLATVVAAYTSGVALSVMTSGSIAYAAAAIARNHEHEGTTSSKTR